MKRLIAIALVAAATSANAAPDLDDVRVAGRTKAGDPIFAIGTPHFVLASGPASNKLALRAGRGVVIAEDDQWISLWDAKTGVRQRHIPAPHEHDPLLPTHFAISDDGGLLAIRLAHATRVFAWPFTTPLVDLDCAMPVVFSHDGGKLVCGISKMSVWDVRGNRQLTELPPRIPWMQHEGIAFSPDDSALVFVTPHTVERWPIGAGDPTVLFRSRAELTDSTTAAGGSAIAVRAGAGKPYTVVDTATGAATVIPAEEAVLSPSGKLLADLRDSEIRVVEIATKKQTWRAPVDNGTKLAWAEDDRAFVWIEGNNLRVEVLPAPPPPMPEGIAFVDWVGPGLATIASRPMAFPVGAFATPATPSPDPPDWALWVALAPDGYTVAAAQSDRHESEAGFRSTVPCEPKLRAWTSRGGERVFSTTCSTVKDRVDPGWEIGGGWIAAIGWRAVTVFDAVTGKREGTISTPGPRGPLATEWWLGAFSATNDTLVLISRTPVPTSADPAAADDRGLSEGCLDTGGGECEQDYDLDVWRVKGTPARVVHVPLEHYKVDRKVPTPAPMALAVDPSGAFAVVGLDSGVIRVIPLANPSASRAERLHEARIVTLAIDPSGTWVYSLDVAGEARIWPLTNLAGPRGTPPR
ncbi:MAG TPA: hypothetical protein VGM88_04935 [Kofleriaceae bacterium]|jgi:hypothetical protein